VSETVFSPEALEDLEQIGDYIAKDNPGRADTFVEELQSKAKSISLAPKAHPKRDDLARNARMAIHGRYLIFFRERAGGVEVVRIIHSARDLSRIFKS
jgi:toxin ParE1/3/4